jgi:hypothetical protein
MPRLAGDGPPAYRRFLQSGHRRSLLRDVNIMQRFAGINKSAPDSRGIGAPS